MSNKADCFMVERVGEESPHQWKRVDTGEIFDNVSELPAGAIWEAPWMGERFKINGDGPVYVVKLPDGREWIPGSEAANCTRRGDDHDCWCVHGDAPNLTVDKEPEPGRTTCATGSGSIGPSRGRRGWHGWLRQGKLIPV